MKVLAWWDLRGDGGGGGGGNVVLKVGWVWFLKGSFVVEGVINGRSWRFRWFEIYLIEEKGVIIVGTNLLKSMIVVIV